MQDCSRSHGLENLANPRCGETVINAIMFKPPRIRDWF